jgi:hypothetical protein
MSLAEIAYTKIDGFPHDMFRCEAWRATLSVPTCAACRSRTGWVARPKQAPIHSRHQQAPAQRSFTQKNAPSALPVCRESSVPTPRLKTPLAAGGRERESSQPDERMHTMARPAELDQHSIRTRAVITGLIGTGRARRMAAGADDDLIKLQRLAAPGEFYWLPRDGSGIRVGSSLDDAEPLQAGFVAAMARAGGERE